MPASDIPEGLGEQGGLLWAGLLAEGSFGPAERVLVLEACRIADRLDKLNALLTGDAESWIDIVESRGNAEVAEVTIDKPLAEARQQAVALKALMTEIRQLRGKDSGAGVGGDEVDELAVARAKRVAAAAGS